VIDWNNLLLLTKISHMTHFLSPQTTRSSRVYKITLGFILLAGVIFGALGFAHVLAFPIADGEEQGGQDSRVEGLVEDVSRRDAYAKHYRVPGGHSYIAKISAEPVHYKDEQGNWKERRLPFVDAGPYYKNEANEFEVRIPKTFFGERQSWFKGQSLGWAAVEANNVPVEVIGEQAIYREAWTGTDVRLVSSFRSVKEEIIAKDRSAPDCFSFKARTTLAFRTLPNNSGFVVGDSSGDYFFIKDFFGHDSSVPAKSVPLNVREVSIAGDPGIEICYTDGGLIYPIVIDPTDQFTPGSNVADGTLNDDLEVWQTQREQSTSNLTHGSFKTIVGRHNNPNSDKYIVGRGFVFFDATSIPDTSIVGSSSIQVWADEVGNGDNDDLDYFAVLAASSSVSTTTLATANHDECGLLDNATELSGQVDITNVSANATTSFALNAAGRAHIKTGSNSVTRFCLREGHDLRGAVGTDSNRYDGSVNTFNYFYAQLSGTTRPPVLVVEYCSF
jgi:hypothetical protein